MIPADDLPYRPCVGVVLLNGQGEVFVGRRADRMGAPEGLGHWWQMPQGGVDPGEDPEEAARRELREETGVTKARFIAKARQWHRYDLPAELIGVAWQGRYRGQAQLWFAALFEGEDRDIELEPQPGHEREFDAWKWVPLDLVPSLVVPFKRPVYEAVVREFASLVPMV